MRNVGNPLLTGSLVLIKGLPLAYNRDLQEDKPTLFSSFDTVEACLQLADRALIYPIAEEAAANVRKRRHGRYLILFAVEKDRIDIVHIVHGARNYRKLFTTL